MQFSRYSPELKLVTVDDNGAIATFKGPLVTTGTVLFIFEPDEQGRRMAGIAAANFFPDKHSRSQLPSVIDGPHPSPLKFVSLEPPEKALEQVVGNKLANQMLYGRKSVIRRSVKVVFHDYIASIDCDSRNYFSTKWSVTPLFNSQLAYRGPQAHGC